MRELRARPVNELSHEELWEAYGLWLLKLAHSVARQYARLGVEFTDLVGPGFEAMTYSAARWEAGKGAKFCHFSKRIILSLMHRAVWKEHGVHRPKPACSKTPDPCTGYLPRDVHEDLVLLRGETRAARSLRVLGYVSEQHAEQQLGNRNLFDLSPEESLDARRAVQRLQQALRTLCQDRHPGKREIGRRTRALICEERDVPTLAQERGVSRQAIHMSLQRGRERLREILPPELLDQRGRKARGLEA